MANIQPLVSVVTCTYNSARFLKETIESVLSQTYQNFEYIIWDDGSTDNTREIVESFNDSRIKYFYANNQGIGEATVSACQKVRGEYIARIDGDDIWLPEKLEKQIGFLNGHEDVVVVVSDTTIIDENSKFLGESFTYTNPNLLKVLINQNRNTFCHSTSVYRTKDYLRCGGYVNIRSRLDLLFFKRMAQLGTIYKMKEHLVKYRIYTGSVGGTTNILDQGPYKDVIQALLNKIYKDLGNNQFDVNIYNQLYIMAKTTHEKNTNSSKRQYKPEKQTLLFNKLKILFGSFYASRVVYSLNDIYGYLKYMI